jgi:hypothetical protein
MPQSRREEYKARKAERDRQQEERAPKPWHWLGQRDPVARFTLYVGLFTLSLVVVGLLQWSIIRDQLIDAQDAMRLDQRAWLGVESLSGEDKIGTVFSAIVHTRNTGKTPAINMHFGGTLDTRNTAPDVASDCAVAMKNPARVLVAPQASHSIPVKADSWGKLDENWLQKLGSSLIYIHGCFLYDDISNGKHWLTFCGYWKGEIQAFENCEAGNDTGDGNGPQQK